MCDSTCTGTRIDRRAFCRRIGTAAVGLPLLARALGDRLLGAAEGASEWKRGGLCGPGHQASAKFRAAFLRPRGEYWLGWPGTSYDIEGHRREYTEGMDQRAKDMGVRLRFEPDYLYDEGAVDRFIGEAQGANTDGVIVTLLHMNQWGMANKIADSGLRTIIFAPIGTAFTGHLAPARSKTGVYTVSSLDLDDVAYGMRMVKTIKQMAATRLAVVVADADRSDYVAGLGTELRYLPRGVYEKAFFDTWEMDDMDAIADEYEDDADDIIEPKREDLIHAARNYLACRRLIEDHEADGMSMICLNLVADRTLPCPPCMAFSRLNDQGVLGGCEGDTNAALGMTLVPYLFGKPGFMQDPVPQTTDNTLLGAHCSSPTRLRGIGGPQEPFILRSHSESDIGVSMQVLWAEDEPVTIASFMGPERLVVESGTVVGNIDTPPAGGCRTNVEVAMDGITDTRDVLGFHQVFFYGDHGRQLRSFCQMAGIEAVSSEVEAEAAREV